LTHKLNHLCSKWCEIRLRRDCDGVENRSFLFAKSSGEGAVREMGFTLFHRGARRIRHLSVLLQGRPIPASGLPCGERITFRARMKNF